MWRCAATHIYTTTTTTTPVIVSSVATFRWVRVRPPRDRGDLDTSSRFSSSNRRRKGRRGRRGEGAAREGAGLESLLRGGAGAGQDRRKRQWWQESRVDDDERGDRSFCGGVPHRFRQVFFVVKLWTTFCCKLNPTTVVLQQSRQTPLLNKPRGVNVSIRLVPL